MRAHHHSVGAALQSIVTLCAAPWKMMESAMRSSARSSVAVRRTAPATAWTGGSRMTVWLARTVRRWHQIAGASGQGPARRRDAQRGRAAGRPLRAADCRGASRGSSSCRAPPVRRGWEGHDAAAARLLVRFKLPADEDMFHSRREVIEEALAHQADRVALVVERSPGES